MRKLLILGDSFADPGPPVFHKSPSWTTIIADECGYQVKNKAIGGASTYWSYLNFEWSAAEYDKIILVTTTPGRLYCPVPGSQPENLSSSHHTTNLFYLDLWKSKLIKGSPDYLRGVKTLDAIEAYFNYIYNFEEHRYYHNLMIEDMKKRRPDMIIVPGCWPLELPEGVPGPCLNDIASMELHHYGLTQEDLSRKDKTCRADVRRCHMSQENNRTLAERAKGWLMGEEVIIDLNDFKAPNEPIDDYFPLRHEWEKRNWPN